jgi:transcriptional regulator with XRE-family HTH domain
MQAYRKSPYGAGRALEPGAVIRGARTSQGLTLKQLGAQLGYSAAQLSRYERGITRLTDPALLRRFASVLGIEPHQLGLITSVTSTGTRHAVSGYDHRRGAHGNTVDPNRQWEDGEDPMRRRELLTGTAALAGAARLSGPAWPRPGTHPTQVGALEDLLYSQPAAEPVRLAALRTAVLKARDNFREARYSTLPAELPRLIATAQATASAADSGEKAAASTLLAESWIVAADFAVKVNDDPLSWLTAGRALQAAQDGSDPLTLADARRAVATAMRRAGQPGRASDLLTRAWRDIEPADDLNPDRLAMYGNLLTVAAYTAATAGDRSAASGLIAEAATTAARLPAASRRLPAFSPAGVTLYKVSIAQVLGDNGTAIDHARTIRIADIPTPERQGRLCIDVARAYHQWGKAAGCFAALLAAERVAPAEVRYRPPVHRMTLDLLRLGPRSLPGLREFARCIGVPDA